MYSYNLFGPRQRKKMHSNIRKVRRFRSSCACAKYHPRLCAPLIHFVVSNASVSGQLRPLRKHAYSNILKILQPKNENFQIKSSDIFHISAQNIDCRYSVEPPLRGGSTEYPQSMFLSKNKKNNVYPCKPQFYNIKVGFNGVEFI